MKKLALFITLALSAGIIMLARAGRSVQAAEEEILSMMKSREASIKELLGEDDAVYTEAQRERLQELINDVIDFTEMSRAALARHWEGLSDVERSKFVSTFSQVVKKSSLRKLDIFHAVITYNSVEVEGNNAYVQTVATYKRTKTAVDYHLHRVNGSWRVTDFLIDEVSTTDSYRKSFQRIIRKHTFQGLMERLRKKLAEE